MKKLVLIDGTNFFFKGSFVGQLSVNGKKVQYIYAFMRNILSLMKTLEKKQDEVTFVLCWDGGYKQRLKLSQQAVDKGLIPKAYKQQRRQSTTYISEQQKEKKQQFMKQLKQTQQLFSKTRVRQFRIYGQQADDIVGSFVYKYKDEFDQIILVTSDKDYFQLLQPNVVIYNSSKKIYIDRQYLKDEYDLQTNNQWIDVGALAGQKGASSDSIYGVPGISYITASKLISKYGTIDKLLQYTKLYYNEVIQQYGGLKQLQKAVQQKTYKLKQMKKQFKVLCYEQVIKLAYELKKMRTFLEVQIPQNQSDWQYVDDYIKQHKFQISYDDFNRLIIQKVLQKQEKSLIQQELF